MGLSWHATLKGFEAEGSRGTWYAEEGRWGKLEVERPWSLLLKRIGSDQREVLGHYPSFKVAKDVAVELDAIIEPEPEEKPGNVHARLFAMQFLAGVETNDDDPDVVDSYEGDERVTRTAIALEKAGVAEHLAKKLGAGSFGTAWALDDGRVAKLTADVTEVKAAYFLSQRKPLPHVVAFYSAWFLENVTVLASVGWDPDNEEAFRKEMPVGLTIMQQVEPADFLGRRHLSRRVHDFKAQNGLSWHELAGLSPAKQRAKQRAGSEDMAAMLREAATKDPKFAELYDNVADALDELRDVGLFAIDAHGGNVGYDDEAGVYKLFDIGVSSVPGDQKPPKLGEIEGTFEVQPQVPVLQAGAAEPGQAYPTRMATLQEDYEVYDGSGRKRLAGPFTNYHEAKSIADARGGVVKFAAEQARDFDSIEAAVDHEKVKGGAMGVIGDGVYVFYPNKTAKRIYYNSGKYHIASRAEPIKMPKASKVAAPATEDQALFKVAYLSGAKRMHLEGEYPLDDAKFHLRKLKRQGRTAWVEDKHGAFVPVPGATRQPKFNDAKASKMKEDFTVATRDVKAVRAGRAVGTLGNSRAIYDWVHPQLVKYSQEVVLCIPLDLRGRPLNGKPYVVAMGQKAEVSVEADDIIRPAIKDNCSGFVVVHNHPSGKGMPSPADRDLTEKIRSKAPDRTPMIDHVVCGDREFYSFADEKLYKVRR